MSTTFDPRPHLRQLESGELYLDVKWRLHWLRSEHPEAVIETQLLSHEGDTAICKATVHIPDGGSATAHASATREPGSDADHIEQAETRAMGRALAALGYGAEYTSDDQVQAKAIGSVGPHVPAEAARERGLTPVPARPVHQVEEEPQPEPARPREEPRAREPRDIREPRPIRDVRQTVEAVDERPAATEPAPLKRGADLRAISDETTVERPPEDVSWTKFWEWAKRRGYRDAAHLRDLLGIEVNALTPGEVRARIKRYEMDHAPPGEE